MGSHSLARQLRRVAPAVVLAIAAAASACSARRLGGTPPPTVLYFTNESLDQAAVYVTGPGLGFRRIGTVFAGRTDTLLIPVDLARRGGTLNIVARLLTRPEVTQTGPVSILPGEQYQVTLPLAARFLSFLPAGS